MDRLCLELTNDPEEMYSRRFMRGARPWLPFADLGRQRPGQRHSGRPPRARIDVRGRVPGLPLVARAGEPLTIRMKVSNLSIASVSRAGHLRRPTGRLGARLSGLRRRAGRMGLRTRLAAGHALTGSSVNVEMTVTAPAKRGRYGLKFDLVSEGIDWFNT